jgi:hypothetical protein
MGSEHFIFKRLYLLHITLHFQGNSSFLLGYLKLIILDPGDSDVIPYGLPRVSFKLFLNVEILQLMFRFMHLRIVRPCGLARGYGRFQKIKVACLLKGLYPPTRLHDVTDDTPTVT